MKLPKWIVLPLIVIMTLVGLGSARLMAIPSLTLDYPAADPEAAGPLRTVTMLVDGVRCVDTARQAASTLEELPGVKRFVAYASRNRVEVSFDPAQISVDAVCEALEGPVWDQETGEVHFHLFKVVELDGNPVSR
jgi:hypothetical protein